jgi:SET domain-containing protein
MSSESKQIIASGLARLESSRIHGTGVFAEQFIAASTEIIEYTGELISKEESLRRCEAGNYFVFTIDETWDLDGDVPANPARFINHSCEPNCEALQDDDNRIWITARRDIRPGEELGFNYGYDLDMYRDHLCRCGTVRCVGFIVAEEFHDLVRRNAAHIATATPPAVQP